MPEDTLARTEYHPELISRRGEVIAWGSTGLVIVAWIILGITKASINWMVPFLAIFLLLASSGITLGNWMDRQTGLRISGEGLSYRNGLRNVTMDWSTINKVRVMPSRWGSKIQVFGERAFFEFRTLGEVTVQGEVKGRMGFEQGEEILRRIVLYSGLRIVDQLGDGYYYARD